MTPYIVSVQVGLPRSLGIEASTNPMDKPWTTGFFKEPVMGLVWLGKTNLEGDGQADLNYHGGPEKAVLAYSIDNYPYWEKILKSPEFSYGAFGENFTVSGQNETSVCIGDIYKVGDAQVQVSQPRQPCWKLARRWRRRTLALEVQRTGKTGWYLRVLKEGTVQSGEALHLLERPFPQWSITRANQIMHKATKNQADAKALSTCEALAPSWRKSLANRAKKGIPTDSTYRLWGNN
ncbi:MAG: MOSC domain-containing protein [Cyanobacteria bacterium P01_F01_bin.150]